MKIFLSWSGMQSRILAEALDWWLPHVLQNVKTFVSTRGIGPGERWPTRLSQALEEYDFGIACLTRANVRAPWLLFECGALAKKDTARLIPILCGVGELDLPKDNPLTLFQSVHLDKEGMQRLARTINDNLAEHKIGERQLDETFATWWGRFAQKIEDIRAFTADPTTAIEAVGLEGAIDEMLYLLRNYAKKNALDEINSKAFAESGPTRAELAMLAGFRRHMMQHGISQVELDRVLATFWIDHTLMKDVG